MDALQRSKTQVLDMVCRSNKVLNCLLLIVICLVSSTITTSSHAEVSEEDGKLFAESVQLLEEKKFQSALIKTRQFLANNPESFEAKTNECMVLLELKKLPEAEICLQSNLTEKPDDLHNLINLGILYTLHENYDAAKAQFSLVHQMYPDDPTAYANLLATRVILDEDIKQITQEHKDLLAKDEFNVQVLVNIGKILNDKKELEKSKYFLDRAYEIDKNHVNVLEQLGVWHALKGDLQNAEKFFLLASEKAPNNISILNNLGLLHKERGDKFNVALEYYKSIEYYESILQIEPDNVIANSGRDYAVQKIQALYQTFYFTIYLIAIFAFGSGIFMSWVYTRDTKKLEKSLETETDNKQIEKILKKILVTKVSRVFLIGLLLIALSIIISSLIWKIPLNDGWDMANWTSTIVEIGIGIIIAATILVYELSKQRRFSDEQKEITKLVLDIKTIEENQQKMITESNKQKNRRYIYVISSLEQYLADVQVLCEERNEHLMSFYKNQNNTPLKNRIDHNLNFLERDVKYLEFLLNTHTDVLAPAQTKRFKTVVDLLNIIIDNHKQTYNIVIHLKSTFAEINKLKRLTTETVDWRDLPV